MNHLATLRQHLPRPTALIHEVATLPLALATLPLRINGVVERSPRGDGHTVLVLPGFTSPEFATLPLRHFLNRIGYRATSWELGQNLGITPTQEAKLDRLVERLAQDRRITIIGWSLGGVYAREVARRQPDKVRRVVSLGTPIRNRDGAEWIVHAFRILNPHAAADLEPAGMERYRSRLPVPMTAVYSHGDGILEGQACMIPEPDVDDRSTNIEVRGTHLGMGFSAEVMAAIAEVLAADGLSINQATTHTVGR